MAFDMGFDFRGTLAYVTDPAYGVFATWSHAYPTTYTNANGDSINAGWTTITTGQCSNESATNDPRIAGRAYQANNLGAIEFKVDLASGSAPGAGDYTVDSAMGDMNSGRSGMTFLVKDGTTTVVNGENGGSGYATLAGHYIDASLANVTATTTWTGTPAAVTFATTTALLRGATVSLSDYTTLAHFRLTLQAAPGGGNTMSFNPDSLQMAGSPPLGYL